MIAADGPLAVVAEIENLRRDDHAVQIFDRFHLDGAARRRGAPQRPCRGKRHAFGNFDPLPDALVVRNHEVARAADAELAHHRWVRAAQHAHNFAVRAAVRLASRPMRATTRSPCMARAAASLGM